MTLQDLIDELQRLPKSALTATVLISFPNPYSYGVNTMVTREASTPVYEGGTVKIRS